MEFFVAFIFAVCAHAVYTIWKLKKNLHMFQLNSYMSDRFGMWLAKKWALVLPLTDFIAVFALPFLLLQKGTLLVSLFLGGFYCSSFIFRPKTNEKKPLVFTARAKRLFGVSIALLFLFYAAALASIFVNGQSVARPWLIGLVIVNLGATAVMWLAHLLLVPIENKIIRWYFRDAQKIVQKMSRLMVIGITGSFGKTTTKYVLNEILRQKYQTLMTPGSFNTPMGITKVIRSDLKPIHEVFVVEMSAKLQGDIAEICQLVPPKIGLITAIGEMHLETFKSIEVIKKTKNELIESLPTDGLAIFNLDNVYCRELSGLTHRRVVTYGIESEDVDYRATDIQLTGEGSHFKVTKIKDGESALFQTKLLGQHNVANILGAIVIASEMGISLSDMHHAIRQLQPVPHRLELKKTAQLTIIDNTFNSNPVGSQMALDVLQQMECGRKILVTPGMIELGEKETELNQKWGESIAKVCDYVILVGAKQTAPIQAGLKSQQFPEASLYVAKNLADANQHLYSIVQPNDVVLFENDLPDDYNE